MTKKRFLVTAGVAVGVWVVSFFVQVFWGNSQPNYGFLLSGSCELTGYPVAQCISDINRGQILLFYFINFLFWFFVVYIISSLFRHK